ncbi:thyrotropin-releasing hormone receptor-like isoform X1 [Apostichopus japonicus]|uniref:thyrotropin-releasing hormone receptor-like isoform X1 n=1 Tax=Stichopus japonicus TaxID=307972 RepID=UPI003AB30B95
MDERNLTDFLDGTTTASTSQEPPNGDVLYKVVATTVYFILGAVAIVGNTMVIIVVLRVKSMRTPTNCHLVSLAFVDAVTGLVPNWLHSIPEVLGNSTWYGAIGCVPMVYVEYLVFNMSAVSIAAFTAERYIAICHPMKSHYMCTINRAVKIIVCVWIFTAIYCVCWLILIDYDETRPNPCYYNTDYEKFLPYVYVADCILFYMIPVGIAIPTYIVIGRALYRSTRSRSKMVASYSRKREDGTTEKAHDKSDAARKQVVKMLFLVVAFFAVLWLPYRLLVVTNSVFGGGIHDRWILFFCRACYYLNSAANPIIYNFMSLNFRRAFKKMCPCLGKIMTPQNGSNTQGQGARNTTTYTTCSTKTSLQGDSVL